MDLPWIFASILDIKPALETPMKSPSAERSLCECSLAELAAQITERAGQLNAANYRRLTLIGEFDRRQGWAPHRSPASGDDL